MDAFYSLAIDSLIKVGTTFLHNWPYLLVSVLIAVLLKLYLKPEKITAFLLRHQRAGVFGATAAAVGTPLCSCGSTAVILGMMASTMPWAPIVAFMVASPLSSPEGMVYSAGLFGWPFALAYFGVSILLGLLGGAAAGFAEKRGWLANQSRFGSRPAPKKVRTVSMQKTEKPCCVAPVSAAAAIGLSERGSLILSNPSAHALAENLQPARTCGCSSAVPVQPAAPSSTCCSSAHTQITASGKPGAGSTPKPVKFHFDAQAFFKETWSVGRKLLVMFFGFAFIGYFLNGLIPPEWISKIFGSGTIYSVPLASILGLPLYINSEASLPLVRAMLENGMSQGAAMAFLITGSGTSIGALGGALTIARWRVIALVIVVLTVGAILAGYAYNLAISFGWV